MSEQLHLSPAINCSRLLSVVGPGHAARRVDSWYGASLHAAIRALGPSLSNAYEIESGNPGARSSVRHAPPVPISSESKHWMIILHVPQRSRGHIGGVGARLAHPS